MEIKCGKDSSEKKQKNTWEQRQKTAKDAKLFVSLVVFSFFFLGGGVVFTRWDVFLIDMIYYM